MTTATDRARGRLASAVLACAAGAWLAPNLADAQAPSGELVYGEHCALCHEQVDERIPHRSSLQQMSAARIVRALDAGAMLAIAMSMNRDERLAVAEYLGTAASDGELPAAAYCADRTVGLAAHSRPSWNGWSPTADNARYQRSRLGRGASAAPRACVGIRLRGRRYRIRGAYGLRRPRVRRQRGRARAGARSRQRLRQVDVASERARAHGADRSGARRRPRAVVRRFHRLVLRRRRRNRRARLADARRDARFDAAHRRCGRARRHRVRARVVMGRIAGWRSRLSVLHFPRQRRRRTCQRRRAALEDPFHGRTA